MNSYQGLNLPALLELMHDLVRPEPVAWLPQTAGWWVLLAWLLALGLVLARHWRARRQANRYRREALAALTAIAAAADRDPAVAAAQIAALLKRTALAAFPRRQVAPLFRADWAAFLCRSAGQDPQVRAAASRLAQAAYRGDLDGRALIAPARRWIEVHRA